MITVIQVQRAGGLDSKRPSNASLNCPFASGGGGGGNSAGTKCGPNGLSIGIPGAPGFSGNGVGGPSGAMVSPGNATGGLVSPRSPLSPVSLRSQRRYSPSLMVPGDYSAALFNRDPSDSSPPGTGGSTTPRRASSEILTEGTDVSLSLGPTLATIIANDHLPNKAQLITSSDMQYAALGSCENDMIQIHSPSSSSEPTLSEQTNGRLEHSNEIQAQQPSRSLSNRNRSPINTNDLSYSPPEIRTPDSTANDICMLSANLRNDPHQIVPDPYDEVRNDDKFFDNDNEHTTFKFANDMVNNETSVGVNQESPSSDEAKFEKFCQYRTIHKVINDFCVRHTREELEFLIGRVGNLKVIDCYFSEKHKTLCMIVEVLD